MSAQDPDGWLVVSDIDDTLTGDRESLNQLWAALRQLNGAVRLALNSSRPAQSVGRTIREEFPSDFAPDAIISGLGTEISIGGAEVDGWRQRFDVWPRDEIVSFVLSLGHLPHPDEFQTPGKASFSVAERSDVDALLEGLSTRGLPVQAIYSGKSDLDLIAPGAGKDNAMLFLAGHFGIDAGRLVAAGDSGNDLAMFEAADRAIAVGNARRELRHSAPRDKTYFARAPHAAGVFEGLKAFGVLPR